MPKNSLLLEPDLRNPVGKSVNHFRSREREALLIYRPIVPNQQKFHESRCHELLLRGGKRAGKSIATAAEIASRIMGQPVIGMNGQPLPLKYPCSTPGDPLLYWFIGWDIKHIGQTIFRIMFEPGLFRVIWDDQLNRWRTYNPANDEDAARYKESFPSEPMIPPRMIDDDSWSWEDKAARVFKSVRLNNGAVICAYPSSAKAPKMGDPVSGLWIDEDIQQPEHLEEWQDRLTDRDGWFLWSVYPQLNNFALAALLQRAEDDEGNEERNIESVQLVMSENPMIRQDAKTRSLERMGSDENIARRDRGELPLEAISMYDFYPGVHLIRKPSKDEFLTDTPLSIIRRIYGQDGILPSDWTRYMAIDPSHSRTAVMFGVVPPPEVYGVTMGPLLVIEDELVLKRFTAQMLVVALKDKMRGRPYEAFIMDKCIGLQTRVGSDMNVFEVYGQAFRAAKLLSRVTGHSFIPGDSNTQRRYGIVRDMLGANGPPTLLLLEESTLETQREFRTYRKKRILQGGETTIVDEPANPRKYDCMSALEYLCSHVKNCVSTGTAYVYPEAYQQQGNGVYQYVQRLLNNSQRQADSYVHLGPGSAA
jgi:hypothetical protein